MNKAEIAEKRRLDEEKLAEDIIEECRVQLMLKFRFLDRALWRMELIPVRSGLDYPLGTDCWNLLRSAARHRAIPAVVRRIYP